ncbi:unnamed protein product, partial [Laminaria digitata]
RTHLLPALSHLTIDHTSPLGRRRGGGVLCLKATGRERKEKKKRFEHGAHTCVAHYLVFYPQKTINACCFFCVSAWFAGGLGRIYPAPRWEALEVVRARIVRREKNMVAAAGAWLELWVHVGARQPCCLDTGGGGFLKEVGHQ